MYKLSLFYRDGDNYKSTWDIIVSDLIWTDFLNKYDLKDDDFLDTKLNSDNLFEIYDFNLSMQDIPLIKEYGQSNMDHPYVSIVSYEEIK